MEEKEQTGISKEIKKTEQEIQNIEQCENEEQEIESFWKDNRGVGVIEIVLILVILIGLVLIFKDQITDIVTDAFDKITKDANSILN